MNKNTKKVAIVIPLYKGDLSADEKISIHHLKVHLDHYDKYLIIPKGTDYRLEGFAIKEFDPKYFINLETYSDLMLRKEFYRSFKDYEYILIHQLDSLVFSDQLVYYCDQNYDYIGAPWFKNEMKHVLYCSEHDCVGNGGFSLRKVDSFLKVLNIYDSPFFRIKHRFGNFFRSLKRMVTRSKIRLMGTRYKVSEVSAAPALLDSAAYQIRTIKKSLGTIEDVFWSVEAKNYYPDFRIAPVDIALAFSFEINPRSCYERNHYRLPFGCHGWARHDKDFWLPFLTVAERL